MEYSRRDFIKTGTLGLLGAFFLPHSLRAGWPGLDLAPGYRAISHGAYDSEHYWRFVVDIRKCIGCGRCVKACKLENDVPLDPEYNRTWVERYVVSEDERVLVDSPHAGINGFIHDEENGESGNEIDIRKSFFVPKLCNQCENPPCLQVCPVGATYLTGEGVVLVDRNACIGCRYCIQACPYGARFLDPRLKIVDKCTWCYHRITKGLPPACVEVCPVGARTFGDIREPEGVVSTRISEEVIGVLKPEIGCDPKVYYIGLEKGVR